MPILTDSCYRVFSQWCAGHASGPLPRSLNSLHQFLKIQHRANSDSRRPQTGGGAIALISRGMQPSLPAGDPLNGPLNMGGTMLTLEEDAEGQDEPEVKTSTKRALIQQRNESKDEMCGFCGKAHKLYQCAKLHGLTPKERVNWIDGSGYCELCMNKHSYTDCPYKNNRHCRFCRTNLHHTDLHVEPEEEFTTPVKTKSPKKKNKKPGVRFQNSPRLKQRHVRRRHKTNEMRCLVRPCWL